MPGIGVGPKANGRRSKWAGSVNCSWPSPSLCIPEEVHMRARPRSGTDGSPATHPVRSRATRRTGEEYGTPRPPRRYARFNVSWPVVVEVGKRFFLLRAVNVSGRGAKVIPTERLGEGSVARLHFHPPDGSSLDVGAIVWRVDRGATLTRQRGDRRGRGVADSVDLPFRPLVVEGLRPLRSST